MGAPPPAPRAAKWRSFRASPIKCVSVSAGEKICVVPGGNPPHQIGVLLSVSRITARWRVVSGSRGTIGRVSTVQVPLVARRHIDLKRVCSACCLPY
ncbi:MULTISPECIES: Ms4527A family Cys-rich leader peptide [unclassified Mycobacteroides]|uniref:Ms4527A family Cys-rich leader peptide n=1 Tax=unclassified Mycobacteroides TaxID=2618759 RepID=UPI0035C807ED